MPKSIAHVLQVTLEVLSQTVVSDNANLTSSSTIRLKLVNVSKVSQEIQILQSACLASPE